MHRLTAKDRNRPVFAYNARSATGRFLSFFRPIFPKVRTCHLCGIHSAGATTNTENRYNEANCHWCNITGTQIRAAFLCCSSWRLPSEGSVLNDSFILNGSLMRLEKNESFRGVDSFSRQHAHHPKGSVLELVHLFRVFGWFRVVRSS